MFLGKKSGGRRKQGPKAFNKCNYLADLLWSIDEF